MARRSSAFDDDLAGLDDLARLPLPAAAPIESAADHSPSGTPPVAGDGADEQTREAGANAPGERAEVRLRSATGGRSAQSQFRVAVTSSSDELEPLTQPESASAGLQPDDSTQARLQSSSPQSRSRSSTTQTAVRLPIPVAKWLSEQAARQQLTFSSVIVQAVAAHREELAPELQVGDGLLVKRRPRTHSAPVTLRFTPAQRELVDGLAQTFECTRSALVLAALQAAMGVPTRS